MVVREKDTLHVIAASYDDVEAAGSDYQGVKELYRELRTSHDFDASSAADEAGGPVPEQGRPVRGRSVWEEQ